MICTIPLSVIVVIGVFSQSTLGAGTSVISMSIFPLYVVWYRGSVSEV